ncbi:TraB/GumN family protein [Miniphocaeibacter halophilus]|uniref:TraB/GumN family protein n=1 Tax=Miniphocaeibacter halophilus TaxID=2931922 RepID=A0AC61MRE0_9FIRM|nr:TraB/GumN family protein [Miniphocaeibacter halophilus]QQK08152.1 TraB/GumN family protein [Miniphocaeibacter halophilus]
MKRKKIYLLVVGLILTLFTLIACSNNNSKKETEKTREVVTTENEEKESLDVAWPFYEIKKDGQVKGHMLGTIHIAKEEMYPFPNEIVESLKESENFITEVLMTDLQEEETQDVLMEKITSGEPLINTLNEETKTEFLKTIESYGLKEENIASLNRFGISQITDGLVYAPMAAFGVDIQLSSLSAKNENQKNIGLETTEDQYEVLPKLYDQPADSNEWAKSILPYEENKKMTEELLQSYIDGNILEKYVDANSLEVTEEEYNLLLVNRNLNWIKQLPQYLERENQSFIAVGAGHFPGEKGLIKLLEEEGYEVNLIEFSKEMSYLKSNSFLCFS